MHLVTRRVNLADMTQLTMRRRSCTACAMCRAKAFLDDAGTGSPRKGDITSFARFAFGSGFLKPE
jgi:hypothetical protein